MVEETCLLSHVRERDGEGERKKRGRRKRRREVIRDVEREEGDGEEKEQRGSHRVSVFTLFPPIR